SYVLEGIHYCFGKVHAFYMANEKTIIMTITRGTIGLLAGALMMSSVFTSCEKKYADDDTIELTSRSERIANTWIFGYAEDDGENVSEDYEQYELYMNTSGEATLEANYTAFGVTYETVTDGTWSF